MMKIDITVYNRKGVNIASHFLCDEEDNLPVLLEAYLRRFILENELEKEKLTMEITESKKGEYITTDNYSVMMKSPRNIEIVLI